MERIDYAQLIQMYSLSSQIFEGITEYILNESQEKKEESESQKGPLSSGRIVADVITTSSNNAEKKYLHDYSYLLFEEELIERDKVLILTDKDKISLAENKPFIKISSKVTFHDTEKINYLIENFNKLGEALANLQHMDTQETQVKSKGFQHSRGSSDKKSVKTNKALTEKAKNMGLNYNEDYLKSLAFLINYGYHNQLEIQQKLNNSLYSAFLKRECLREDEEILIKKYSRKTEKELVVFGIITQSSRTNSFNELEPYQGDNIKESMMYLVEQLTNIEQQFSGKLINEFVIDPIAIYTEL